MYAKFYDSHKLFKSFTVESDIDETERIFSRRCWLIYSDLIDKYETPANNNRVYMYESRLYEK